MMEDACPNCGYPDSFQQATAEEKAEECLSEWKISEAMGRFVHRDLAAKIASALREAEERGRAIQAINAAKFRGKPSDHDLLRECAKALPCYCMNPGDLSDVCEGCEVRAKINARLSGKNQ